MKGRKLTMRRMMCAASVLLAAISSAAVAQEPTSAPVAVAPPMAEGVAAVVNDEIISTYDLRQRMTLMIATSGVRVTAENLPQIQQRALTSLIDERLQMQELKRFQVNIPDQQVDAELRDLTQRNNTTPEALFASLATVGVEPDTLRNQVRAQIGWGLLVRERFRTRARVGEDQIDATLQRIAAASSKPRFLIGEIYIEAARVGGMEQAVAGAQQLFDQLVAGAPFQAVARQFSNAPSSVRDGNAGWIIPGDMPPEVEYALQNMEAGQLSRPIQTRDGVYIIYLRETQAGGGTTMVSLKQAAVRLDATASEADVQAATAKLAELQPRLTCDNIAEQAERAGVVAADLGEQDLNQLTGVIRDAATPLSPGQVSAPVRSDVGVHLVAVCGKRLAGVNMPSREEVGSRMMGEQLSMFARRYLRDLHNSATIELR